MTKLSLIFLNIRRLFKENRVFVLFFIVSQIAACLAVFFAIGAIQNTRNEQKDIDMRTMFFEVCVEDEPLPEMEKKAENVLAVIPKNMIASAGLSGYISGDFSMRYCAVMRSDGNFFTSQQLKNGDHVIRVFHSDAPEYLDRDKLGDNNIGDRITVAGVEYVIEKAGQFAYDYSFPIKAANPELTARRFRIELNEVPDKALADEITGRIKENFPVREEMISPEIPDLVTVQFNRTMLISSALVIAIVVLNLSYCYCYLFIKRRKMYAVYKICGGTNGSVSWLMIGESAVISLVCYGISVLAMKPFIPLITGIYPAAVNLYTTQFFAIVGGVYLACTVLFLKLMYLSLLNRSEIELKRGD